MNRLFLAICAALAIALPMTSWSAGPAPQQQDADTQKAPPQGVPANMPAPIAIRASGQRLIVNGSAAIANANAKDGSADAALSGNTAGMLRFNDTKDAAASPQK